MSIIEKALDKLQPKEQEHAAEAVDELPRLKPERSLPGGPELAEAPQEQKVVKVSRTGQVDLQALQKAGIITPHGADRQLLENYRRIKRPLLTHAFDANGRAVGSNNIVMVTSALEGEGKTYTSLNLALSIATEYNHRVLVVDADVFKHSLSRLTGLDAEPGLVDYLADPGVDLADCLIRTNIDGLTVLPPGRRHDRLTELLASQRMRELVKDLSERYHDRLVIFDTPPLLQQSASSVLGNLAGQVLVVVEAEKTPQHVVKEALATIVGCDTVGLVLNKSNVRFGSESQYYGYE